MRTLVSNEGRVGYGYDKGEVPSFDEYVQRLSKYGLPEEYLYETLYELPDITDGIDYERNWDRLPLQFYYVLNYFLKVHGTLLV